MCEIAIDDSTSISIRRHGNPSGPRLLLSHGNGLAIDLYYPFWQQLGDDYDLLVFDLRNHGWNDVSSIEDHNVISFVTDLDRILNEIDDRFGIKPIVGVFHSLSALVALLYSSSLFSDTLVQHRRGFQALVLFDPPMHRPGKSHKEFDDAVEVTARRTRNRTYRFNSREQLLELLNFFPAYSRMVPGARELMVNSLLRKSTDWEGYELRCPPTYEAKIVDYIRAYADQVDLDKLPCPVRITGADPVLPFSYLPTVDLSHMLHVDFDFVPETTHYMQMEKPLECAHYVRSFVDRVSSP